MNRIRDRTRLGQILEQVTAKALSDAGYTYRFDWQYDEEQVKLDFTIPDTDTPEVLIEVTQTETRDSLKRKLLRYFELVSAAKVHFGAELIAISMIYGTPTRDLPAANLEASFSFFDAAFMPRVDGILDVGAVKAVADLEKEALELAQKRVSPELAASHLKENQPTGFSALVTYLKQQLKDVEAKSTLQPMWELERIRTNRIEVPEAPEPIETYYKRGLLQALFLSEEQYNELILVLTDDSGLIDPNREGLAWSENLTRLLEKLGLARVQPTIVSFRVQLRKELEAVLRTAKSRAMIDLARKALAKSDLCWFFEDIYDEERRYKMVDHFRLTITQGLTETVEAIVQNLKQRNYVGLTHKRTWVVELILRTLNVSSNSLTGAIFQHKNNVLNLGDPLSHIIPQSARFMNTESAWRGYAEAIVDSTFQELEPRIRDITSEELSDRILASRLDGAMYLQKFNPFYEVVEAVLVDKGWSFSYQGFPSILGDLVGNPQVGRFTMYKANKKQKRLFLTALSVHDGNEDHKSKEWAARGRAMRYRTRDGKIETSNDQGDMVFVCDGEWKPRFRMRLEKAGWRTCTLEALPNVLEAIERGDK